MSHLLTRIARLEHEYGSLRALLRWYGVRVPAGATDREMLASVDDATLERIAADLEAGMSPTERERQRAWIAGLSNEELERLPARVSRTCNALEVHGPLPFLHGECDSGALELARRAGCAKSRTARRTCALRSRWQRRQRDADVSPISV
jgi:hypothetical protein